MKIESKLVPALLVLLTVGGCNKEDDPDYADLTASKALTTYDCAVILWEVGSAKNYHLATSKGVCWSTTKEEPTLDDNNTSSCFSYSEIYNRSKITGLLPATKYYVRAYVRWDKEVSYSNVISITTDQVLKDVENNTYKTAIIANRVWMAENLKTRFYSNGQPVYYVENPAGWAAATEGAFCYYNNDEANKSIYGCLYNGYAITDSRKICPAGWHVSTYSDWDDLKYTIGDEDLMIHLREKDNTYWSWYEYRATNSTGFSALPGGMRNSSILPGDTGFRNIHEDGMFWSPSTGNNQFYYDCHVVEKVIFLVTVGGNDRTGYSVRCVKDVQNTN